MSHVDTERSVAGLSLLPTARAHDVRQLICSEHFQQLSSWQKTKRVEKCLWRAYVKQDSFLLDLLLKSGVPEEALRPKTCRPWQLQQLTAYITADSEEMLKRYLTDTGFKEFSKRQKNDLACQALRTAAWRGYSSIVTVLIDAGVSADARVDEDRTALMQASASGCCDVAAQLIEAGADLLAKDSEECTAMSLAVENKQDAVVHLLQQRIAPRALTAGEDKSTKERAPPDKSQQATHRPEAQQTTHRPEAQQTTHRSGLVAANGSSSAASREASSGRSSVDSGISMSDTAMIVVKMKQLRERTTFRRLQPPPSEMRHRESVLAYNWSRVLPGIAVIFSVEEFLQKQHNVPEFRKNSDQLKTTLEALGFRVHVLRNSKAEEIIPMLKAILTQERQLPTVGCFYLHVMSHGHLNQIYGSDMKLLQLHLMTDFLSDVQALRHKPKVLVIDTCQTNPQQAVTEKNLMISHKDFFLLYSTRWGQRAWVFPDVGALCTHKVIESLQQYGVDGRRMQGKQTGLLRCIDHAGEKTDAYLQKYNLRNMTAPVDQLCVVIKTTYAKELYFPCVSSVVTEDA